MNFFMFIVNDFPLQSGIVSAETLVDKLFNMGYWVYSEQTSFVEKYAKGDQVIVYIPGVDRRYFSGSFEIGGKAAPNPLQPADEDEKELYEFFSLASPIEKVERWKNPVYIEDMIGKLSFLQTREDLKLLFRQSAHLLSEKDYQFIISQAKRA